MKIGAKIGMKLIRFLRVQRDRMLLRHYIKAGLQIGEDVRLMDNNLFSYCGFIFYKSLRRVQRNSFYTGAMYLWLNSRYAFFCVTSPVSHAFLTFAIYGTGMEDPPCFFICTFLVRARPDSIAVGDMGISHKLRNTAFYI